jgi:hypothetical protein
MILLAASALLLGGCAPDDGKNNGPNGGDTVVIQPQAENPAKGFGGTKISSISVDLNLDKKDDKLVLMTSAERDSSGDMMWDDGQKWLFYANVDGKYYTLIDEYVQLGSIYYVVDKAGENDAPVITSITSTDSSLVLSKYSYQLGKDSFEMKKGYESGATNRIYSSIPEYK